MFDFLKKDKKDPADIAREFGAKHDIEVEVKDEEPTPEGAESSPAEGQEEGQKIDDDKSSQEGEPQETPEDKGEVDQDEQKILDTPDDELDDDGKQQKEDIKSKRKKDAEQRITELVSTVKDLNHRLDERDKEYRAKLQELEAEKQRMEKQIGEPSQESAEQILEKQEQERVAKYLAEDKDAPREKRREMSKEDLEEWLVEDYAGATEWLMDRRARRDKEKQADADQLVNQAKARDILHQQELSRIRVEARHPELKLSVIRDRKQALIAEGKSESEVQKILCEENPKYAVMSEALSDKAFVERLMVEPNAPELLEKEMLKRMGKSEGEGKTREEELESRIAELEDMVKSGSTREPVGAGVGSRSTGGGKPMKRNEANHNPELEKALKLMKKKGYSMSVDDFNKIQEERAKTPGVEVYEGDGEN